MYWREVYLEEEEAAEFSNDWGALMKLPIMKFAIGCVAYMTSVLLLTHLRLSGEFQIISSTIRSTSILSVFMVAGLLTMLERRKEPKSEYLGNDDRKFCQSATSGSTH